MDFPFYRKERYDISNNWWFLPTDLFKIEQDKQKSDSQRRSSPLLSYLGLISDKDKFNYIVIIIIVVLFIYHLNLHSSVWIGFIIAIIIAYYLNEKRAQEVNTQADQLWVILNGDLLKGRHYFINDPQLIRWVNDVGELKKYNVLEFNKMIKALNQMLKLTFDLKRGVVDCKETIDIIKDSKTSSLNIFHSMVYNIPYPALRDKYNFYLSELGKILNDRMTTLFRISKLYYMSKPTDIQSNFGLPRLTDPVPTDPLYSPHYSFYN